MDLKNVDLEETVNFRRCRSLADMDLMDVDLRGKEFTVERI